MVFGLPYGSGDFKGTVAEAPKESHRSGTLDTVARFAINLLGGPAMSVREFGRWQQQGLLGVSLTVVAPTGQYDGTRLVNWGSNRWSFKPEIGYSQRWGHWLLDGYLGAWFFTTNPEFFSENSHYPGIRAQTEDPIEEVEMHLSYDFRPRLWVSLDANFWRGGTTSLNGVENPLTTQKSSRIGVTAAIPLTAHQALKLSLSDGAYSIYGGNYKSISVGWQYSWLDGKF